MLTNSPLCTGSRCGWLSVFELPSASSSSLAMFWTGRGVTVRVRDFKLKLGVRICEESEPYDQRFTSHITH